jgi:hypothetical protein
MASMEERERCYSSVCSGYHTRQWSFPIYWSVSHEFLVVLTVFSQFNSNDNCFNYRKKSLQQRACSNQNGTDEIEGAAASSWVPILQVTRHAWYVLTNYMLKRTRDYLVTVSFRLLFLVVSEQYCKCITKRNNTLTNW